MRHAIRLLSISLLFVLSACFKAYATPIPADPPVIERTLFATPTFTMEPAMTAMRTPVPSALRRGINFGNMLEAPKEGDWGLTVQEDYFDLVKEAGFDFVRLPVRWFAHT